VTLWTAACQDSLSLTILEFAQTHIHWVGDAIQSSHPLSPPYLTLLLPLIFPRIRVFSNESVLHIRWPKYWRFSFNISPSSEYSGLISFSIDWSDLLAVQGTQSLLQHHSLKALILRHSAFFMVQLTHPYMTTGKILALTIWIFVGKVIALLFNTLSSVQFSCSVVSDSLQPHGLQHARLPCSSLTPRACSNLCPLSQWCHPNISSSVIPFSSCLQSFPASGSFPMSQFFTSGGQSIGASASASVLPVKIQDWFLLGFDMVWSPCSPRNSQESSPTPQFKSSNMLSRFVKAFLPRSKHLLISWR